MSILDDEAKRQINKLYKEQSNILGCQNTIACAIHSIDRDKLHCSEEVKDGLESLMDLLRLGVRNIILPMMADIKERERGILEQQEARKQRQNNPPPFTPLTEGEREKLVIEAKRIQAERKYQPKSQTWVHVYEDRKTGDQNTEFVSHSYDDAMEALYDYHSNMSKDHTLLYTIETTRNKDGSFTTTTHEDLDSEVDAWDEERTRDAESYRDAATLSANQLVDTRRTAWR